MHQTMALKDNLGDITGKAGSQTTAAALVGTTLAVSVSAGWAGQDTLTILMAFIPAALLSIHANNQCARVVRTRVIDEERADKILHDLFQHGRVPTPDDMVKEERLVWRQPSPFRTRLFRNPPLSLLSEKQLKEAISSLSHRSWYVMKEPIHARQGVHLWWRKGSSGQEVLEGYIEATKHRWRQDQLDKGPMSPREKEEKGRGKSLPDTRTILTSLYEADWDMDAPFFHQDRHAIEVLRVDDEMPLPFSQAQTTLGYKREERGSLK